MFLQRMLTMTYNKLHEKLSTTLANYRDQLKNSKRQQNFVSFLDKIDNNQDFQENVPTENQVKILKELVNSKDITLFEDWLQWPSLYLQDRIKDDNAFYYTVKLMSIVNNEEKLKRYYPSKTSAELEKFKNSLYDEGRKNIYATLYLKKLVKDMDAEEQSSSKLGDIFGRSTKSLRNKEIQNFAETDRNKNLISQLLNLVDFHNLDNIDSELVRLNNGQLFKQSDFDKAAESFLSKIDSVYRQMLDIPFKEDTEDNKKYNSEQINSFINKNKTLNTNLSFLNNENDSKENLRDIVLAQLNEKTIST